MVKQFSQCTAHSPTDKMYLNCSTSALHLSVMYVYQMWILHLNYIWKSVTTGSRADYDWKICSVGFQYGDWKFLIGKTKISIVIWLGSFIHFNFSRVGEKFSQQRFGGFVRHITKCSDLIFCSTYYKTQVAIVSR